MLEVLWALTDHVRDDPDAPAICTDDERLDYRGLLNRVRAAAAGMLALPETVAIAGPNGIDWVAAGLALGWTGRRMVPIPPFFAPAQIAHLVRDAGIGAILWTGVGPPETDSRQWRSGRRTVARRHAGPVPPPRDGAERIIYTSGTTGAPRGVIHGARQLDFSLRALAGAALGRAGAVAPASLRFVAVGGAPLAPSLVETAWTLGIPAHEGYGLSECCSVVALSRPGEAVAGAVGRPLDGLTVVLDDGEIVVRGDSVMTGYLGGARLGDGACWRTGDLGEFDAEGRLIVRGRKDSVIVTGFGRNVSPEWIEALALADPRIARAVLMGHGAAGVVLAIWLAAPGDASFDVDARIAGPGDVSPTLFAASGRPRRAALASHFRRRVATALAAFKAETLMEMK